PENLQIRFENLEGLVARTRGSVYLRDLRVSKVLANGSEILVHPFWYAAVHANWREELSGWERLPLEDSNGLYGYLYLSLDRSALHGVRWATGGLAFLLAVSLVLLLTRIRAQEMVLTRTTVELEAKRRELIRLERLALAGQLTANIFHDMKKPVLNIKHELADLQEQAEASSPLSSRIKNLREQTDLFFSMLRDLNLERFVRADDQQQEYVDVNDLLDRSRALVRYEQGGVKVETSLSRDLPPLLAHPNRLVQVFSNLILNAFQTLEGTGNLQLATRLTDDGKIEVQISDTGHGIPAEGLENIFRPFFTTREKSGGTGLGLYISRNIVEDMGGEIRVASNTGKGTTFTIVLPVAGEGCAQR
ncbi:MAG: ATP-binding protein, partial [bacterium]